MSWIVIGDAVTELRRLISDGPTDRLLYKKRLIGPINGTNTVFKTLEPRIVSVPLVYKNGVAATVSSYDLLVGEVTLSSAPVDGDLLEATYYHQYFLDSELEQFLEYATQWIGLGQDPTSIPIGLQPAAIHYAGQDAYHKLAVRLSDPLSSTYLLEDMPQRSADVVKSYMDLSKQFHDKAKDLRLNYYQRNDQAAAPLFGINAGAISRIP